MGPYRPRRLAALLIALALLAGIVAPTARAGTGTPAALAPADPWADVLPAQVDDVRATTEADISRYAMDITVDRAAGEIGGTMSIAFVNWYGEPLDALYLRLFPNAEHYGEGGTAVRDVTVDGVPVTTALSAEDTVLALPLATPLLAGERATITLGFMTTVPLDSTGSYGILSRSSVDGIWALADWYPVLAGYEPSPGRGWRLDPPFDGVDPTFGDVALYDVTLHTGGLTVISTGITADPTDAAVTRVIGGPVRDLTIVLGDGWSVTTRQAGDTLVRYATLVDDADAIDAVLGVVTRSLENYGARFGPYAYRELDLVDVPLTSGTLGISWSGLVFLDGPSLARDADDPQFLDFLLSHEVGHQWWANMVGFNSNDHTFITEGLTNYLMTMEVEWSQGRLAAVDMIRSYIASRYLALIRAGGDGVADVPFPDAPPGFGDLVYGKAALGFLAIRLEIGDAAFVAALRTLAAADPAGVTGYRFRIAGPDDLRAAFEAASGQSLGGLWSRWFEQDATTAADVEALIAEYAAG